MYRYARNLLRDESREGIVLPEGEFPVLYADPPWEYSNSGFEDSAASHYPTMPTERLAAAEGEGDLAWEVRRRAAENAVLFMWATNPLLEDALRVMNAWGFEYKTNMVWVKNRGPRMGFYVMGRHELLLIGVRGSSLPRQGSQPPSVLDAPVGAHSAKPHEVYDLVESMYAGPYLELFARNRREGWTPFGDEVGNG
jgi:N6-adenosine-specific RNA methylase IME4